MYTRSQELEDHLTDVRIAWKIPSTGQTGNGDWHKNKMLPMLEAHVFALTLEYGRISHWIQERSTLRVIEERIRDKIYPYYNDIPLTRSIK